MGERREYMVNLRGLLELPSTLLCAVCGGAAVETEKQTDLKLKIFS